MDDDLAFFPVDSDDDDDMFEPHVPPIHAQMSTKAIGDFKKYVIHARQNFLPLEKGEVAAIKVLDILRKKRATLDTYPDIMEWHFRESGSIKPHETLADETLYISRESLMKRLSKRYNMDPKNLVPKRHIVLPSSRTKVGIVWHHARDCVVSLLTDPRLSDNDYLFFGNDPLAPPPENLAYIADINTGTAYRESYKQLITKPGKQILVPIIMYIDGAVTGQFDKLEITSLKMTLGIFNRKARDKEFLWRALGYVPNYSKESSRAKKMFLESGHLAAANLDVSDGEGSDDEVEEVHSAQDFHSLMDVILESYRELESETMLWDLNYRGKLHKDVELVFYLSFVKCDTSEADKLCGQFRSRTGKVAMLCRYCLCPTDDSDDHLAKHKYKQEATIKKLVDANNVEALRKISQQPVNNAFHGLRFGLQNDRGIHGACPLELLHALLLGIFTRMRDCFFSQIGKDSTTAEEINALSKLYGKLFTRQSDRNLPKTHFAKGIQKGKLMAKEFSGVLLVMAAILQSTRGRELLSQARGQKFREEWLIDDWAMLIETLLEWEAFLKLDEMEIKHVKRLGKKHRYIMYLMRKVGNRTEGMGLKIIKFHAILHLAEDIIMFGVPMNTDTGSNESHHKVTKIAAKLTQKNFNTFESQTEQRLLEFQLLDLAMAELSGDALWEYFDNYEDAEEQDFDQTEDDSSQEEEETVTGGTQIAVFMDEDGQAAFKFVNSRSRNQRNVLWDYTLQLFLYDVQEAMKPHMPDLDIRTEHKRNGQIFRGCPRYRQEDMWNDWAIFDWGASGGHVACEIWCFVNLSRLPDGVTVQVGDVFVQKGVFAVVESTEPLHPDDEEEYGTKSELFTAIFKEVHDFGGEMNQRKFYI